MNYQYVVDLCNITYDSKGTVIDYSSVDQHTIYFTDIIEAEMYFIELTVLVEVALWSSQFGHEVSLCGVRGESRVYAAPTRRTKAEISQ